MTERRAFERDWTSPPSVTISAILKMRAMSPFSLALGMNLEKGKIEKLLANELPIDKDIAERLATTLGGSVNFWEKRQETYVSDIELLQAQKDASELSIWLRNLPVQDMIKFQWIDKKATREQQAQECLEFFGVKTLSEYEARYCNLISQCAFRTSGTYESKKGALIAWLRQGERESYNQRCAPWNPKLLKESIPELRRLSRISEPTKFLPPLSQICARSGVVLAVVRAPKGCSASGTTRFLSEQRAIMMLSFRYKTDDHFWFSFFHELGHLLLHDKQLVFIEGADKIDDEQEKEANVFASNALIPENYKPELFTLPNEYKLIMRFAKRVGVSPGIVVGQMQHYGILKHSQMNFLKRRYVWEKA
jgi:plasmid maintenance system antidote protein VapI